MPTSKRNTKPPVILPKYACHRASGRAVVIIHRKTKYLPGEYGSPESMEAYQAVCARLLANDPDPFQEGRGVVSVAEVALSYVKEREVAFKGRRGEARLRHRMNKAIKALRTLYGATPADEFTPAMLMAVQRTFIQEGLCRSYVADLTGIVKQAFKHGVREGVVSGSTWYALTTVETRPPRGTAPAGRKVKPVPLEHVEATLEHLNPTVRAMVELQLATAARPSEICNLRGSDIDTTGRVWTAEISEHKNDHRDGPPRVLYIGPKGQAALRPYLDTTGYVFSPRREAEARSDRRRAARRTKLYPSHVRANASKRRRSPKRKPRERYDAQSYRVAIQRAAVKAGVPRWFPYQLRHTAATALRRQFGIEAAAVMRGHSSAKLTDSVYAERDASRALEVASKAG